MPELRIDPIVGRRVYIAEDRAGRPQDYADAQYVPQRRQDCPFCAGHEYETPDAVAEINGAEVCAFQGYRRNRFGPRSGSLLEFACILTGPRSIATPRGTQTT